MVWVAGEAPLILKLAVIARMIDRVATCQERMRLGRTAIFGQYRIEAGEITASSASPVVVLVQLLVSSLQGQDSLVESLRRPLRHHPCSQ